MRDVFGYDCNHVYVFNREGEEYIAPPDNDPSECILMQCTGLRDKNGNLIFERDILIRCDTNPVKVVVSIEKTNIGFSVVHRNLTKNKLYSFCDKYEIIGNIHDTPELLKGGKQNAD